MYEKMELEKIELADEQAMTLILYRNRGVSYEGQVPRMDRVERGLVTGDVIWMLFTTMRTRILDQGKEIAELRERLSRLAPKAKPARRKAVA